MKPTKKRVITKQHRTNRPWYSDMEPDHVLLHQPLNFDDFVKVVPQPFTRDLYALDDVVSKNSSFAVAGATDLVFVPIDVALALPQETLDGCGFEFSNTLRLLKDQGVVVLIIGYK